MQTEKIDPTPEEGRALDGAPCVCCGKPSDYIDEADGSPVCEACYAEIDEEEDDELPDNGEDDRGFRERRGLL